MADYRELARQAAKRYGLDPHIFERQIGAESNFNPDARSGAGAVGIAQIMPDTAKGWGVDPTNPVAALNAAAKNMASYVKRYGSYENALRAYNAGPGRIEASRGFGETNAYVAKILMNGRDPGHLGRPGAGGGGGGGAVDTSAAQAPDPSGQMARQTIDPGSTVDASSLLQLSSQRGQAPGGGAANLPTPAAIAGPALPDAYRALSSGQAPKPRADVGALISAARTPGAGSASVAAVSDAGAPLAPSGQPGKGSSASGGLVPLGGSKNAGKGDFEISGPDPKRLKPYLTQFAGKVADIYGGELTGLDGSSHSKYTVNGNVSQHYSGEATDVFGIGGKKYGDKGWQSELVRAGRAALIAAGMPRAKALKQTGGLYNVGTHQIIFNVNGTQYGGNHLDHLHISARKR